MDFQAVVDAIGAMTCVVSVEKLENGGRGKIRIVTGNEAYIRSIERPAPGPFQLDGEWIEPSAAIDVSVRPQALRILAPAA